MKRALLLVGALLACRPALAQQPPSPISITFADVGQGDAELITTPDGKHVLIDAGPTPAGVERLFAGARFDTLDLVIASHNHSDHIGGMPWVLQRFVVRAYMENGIPANTSIYRNTMQAVEREPGLRFLQPTSRDIAVGTVVLHVLPPAHFDASQNDNSVGVLLEYGKFRALLTGDSERKELAKWVAEGRISHVQVVKAAHHGSGNGVITQYVSATRPQVVVMSLAANNTYHHPDPRVVVAWQRAGATVYRTDVDGSVMVNGNADGTFRAQLEHEARRVSGRQETLSRTKVRHKERAP